MIDFEMIDERMPRDILGFLPVIFDDGDPAPAREQAEKRYAHGGGWDPMPGWQLDPLTMKLKYPGDPPLKPLAKAYLVITGETLLFYRYSFVAVIQSDGSFEVARMD